MHYTSTMTSKGQVTVPVAIRRKLGLKPGQPVRFEMKDSTVELQRNTWEEDLKLLQAKVRAHMQQKNLPFPATEDWQKVREQAWDEAAAYRIGRLKQ